MMISKQKDERLPASGRTKVNNGPSHVVSKPDATNNGILKSEQKDVKEPSPVAYLRSLFGKTDRGREILKRPNRCMFSKPSQEATDAYDMTAVRAIREKDIERLRSLLQEGKSLDACNRFGESLIHMACRRGDADVVRFLIQEARVNVAVRDDYGRLPLHDAMWTTVPNFDVMDVVLQAVAVDLLVSEDVRGHTPFHYARKEHWEKWLKFLQEREELLLRRLSAMQVAG